MNDSMPKAQPLAPSGEKLPWTDPEIAEASIVDYTRGGASGPTNIEDASYSLS
ncbi:hypothetical protein [Sphingomonas suaedae]|uniref:hypothetical protein n=1 Tax=Sphingomonas suaedae TaxID=2599297 RepID=UPI00164817CC|nr:hypothetical protein [Sphingomonas suaedae]